GAGHAAKDIAAAHHDGDLSAGSGDFGNLLGDTLEKGRFDAEGIVARQRLARNLEQNTLVGRRHRWTPYGRVAGPRFRENPADPKAKAPSTEGENVKKNGQPAQARSETRLPESSGR